MTNNRSSNWTIPTGPDGQPLIELDLAQRIEGIEIDALNEIDNAAGRLPDEVIPSSQKSYGRATGYFAPTSDVLALNRVIGLGLWSPADDRTIQTILSDVKDSGATRFFVQVSPFAQPHNIGQILQAKGMTFRNNWVKFIRKSVR